MPLPLPDLDDRQWADLVDEARSLIPRLAPGWTDVNVSDPGMTLIDLLAAVTEAGVFALDRVPRTHRARFVELAGVRLRPTVPASTPLAFGTAAAPLRLGKGMVLAAETGGQVVRHRLLGSDGSADPDTAITVWGCGVRAVQTEAAATYVDHSADVQHGTAFDALGSDPSGPPAEATLLLGFGPTPLFAADARLSLWLALDDAAIAGQLSNPPEDPAGLPGVATGWEFFDGTAWLPFDPGSVVDDTRALTRSGRVVLPVGSATWVPAVLGLERTPQRWVRVRVLAGRHDVAPRLTTVVADTAPVVQAVPLAQDWVLAPGHDPLPAAVVPGATLPLRLRTTVSGALAGVDAGTVGDPVAQVLPSGSGRIGLTLVAAGVADGAPSFATVVQGAPLEDVAVWTAGESGCLPWQVVDTLLRSGAEDRHVLLDPATGDLVFGDGEHGRYPDRGETIVVSGQATLGVPGTPTRLASWSVAVTDPLTQAAQGPSPTDTGTLTIRALPARRAWAADDVIAGQGRAAEGVWLHERLLEIAPEATEPSLDQLDRDLVLSRARPPRAATLLDFERIALEVPGTGIRRARAWADLDPGQPGATAEGTVTVVVVPGLPASRPAPTPATLSSIRRWLCARRTLGTRLVVTGPEYVEITVRTELAALPATNVDRVRADALARLSDFLHPLTGGPLGRGWPFGRDVFRADVLAVLDRVQGVDNVQFLELLVAGRDAGCGNVCVGPLQLVVSGAHEVTVR